MDKHEKRTRGGARATRASRTLRVKAARSRGGVARTAAGAASAGDAAMSGAQVREILARGDAREMRGVEARLRKWLKGTYELVDELEHLIVELEEPRR